MRYSRSKIDKTRRLEMPRLVKGRLAKIAAMYTGGFVQVVFRGNDVCTDNVRHIFLPGNLVNEDKIGAETSQLAWAFVNHEMGHIHVQRHLEADTLGDHTAVCNADIYSHIPVKLRAKGVGMAPGQPCQTPVMLLKSLQMLAPEIVDTLRPDVPDAFRFFLHGHAMGQIKHILNAVEDPRMETSVMQRWSGCREHLEWARDHHAEKWVNEHVPRAVSEGHGESLWLFTKSLYFALYRMSDTVAAFGPWVVRGLEENADLIDLYIDHGDWNTHHGFFDAFNLAIALYCRILAGTAFDFVLTTELPPDDHFFEDRGEGEDHGEGEEAGEGKGDGEGSDDGTDGAPMGGDGSGDGAPDDSESAVAPADTKSDGGTGAAAPSEALEEKGESSSSSSKTNEDVLIGSTVKTEDGRIGKISAVYPNGDVEIIFSEEEHP